ncbi:MAG: hypothetical protein R3C17_00895 [Planctomycetaceae bacterium]
MIRLLPAALLVKFPQAFLNAALNPSTQRPPGRQNLFARQSSEGRLAVILWISETTGVDDRNPVPADGH